MEREVTVSTRLQLHTELTDYLEAFISDYSRIKREMWQEMTSPSHDDRFKTLAEYKKYCRSHYGLLGRTVNSLIFEVQGMMNSYMELKKTELRNLETKISSRETRISEIKGKLDVLKPLMARNIRFEKNVRKYHSLKHSLYWQKNRLNKMKQSANRLRYQIEKKIYSLCFGSKKEFSKQFRLNENGYRSHEGWHNDFVKHRDKNILYVGASNEKYGNQMFQMTYNPKNTDNIIGDTFSIKVRKENVFCKDKSDEYIVLNNLPFKYRKQELRSILKKYDRNEDYNSPLTYRFHRDGNKWYLQVMFKVFYDDEYESRTTSKYGTIGLDYNDGFIEMTETDESGNIVAQEHYELKYHGTGNTAETEIRQVISRIVNRAEQHCKDIGAEDLDFKRTKASQLASVKNKGRNYNRMLHKFDYSRYKDTLRDICFNHRVRLTLVNPKNTSKIGKEKYADTRKMTVHQAASYVIARKAQGFNDELKSNKAAKKTA